MGIGGMVGHGDGTGVVWYCIPLTIYIYIQLSQSNSLCLISE
eukprot:NODE_11358_length_186_cov_16.941606_g11275_i0.p2 GENE.NODE_11358_length_186_cov_16.941606_g11275_i0~~NODE_11358_length_186_cov_16.941606_g11275_i0.p2  ORF type:complete len:52 (+),score=16.44 NODE_11358_length_186_cov_16.941606_g11275_i0:32-157(+)